MAFKTKNDYLLGQIQKKIHNETRDANSDSSLYVSPRAFPPLPRYRTGSFVQQRRTTLNSVKKLPSYFSRRVLQSKKPLPQKTPQLSEKDLEKILVVLENENYIFQEHNLPKGKKEYFIISKYGTKPIVQFTTEQLPHTYSKQRFENKLQQANIANDERLSTKKYGGFKFKYLF